MKRRISHNIYIFYVCMKLQKKKKNRLASQVRISQCLVYRVYWSTLVSASFVHVHPSPSFLFPWPAPRSIISSILAAATDLICVTYFIHPTYSQLCCVYLLYLYYYTYVVAGHTIVIIIIIIYDGNRSSGSSSTSSRPMASSSTTETPPDKAGKSEERHVGCWGFC